MQVRGNDEVEVTRNLKQAKPNELDSHFRGNDVVQVRGNDVVQVRGNDGMYLYCLRLVALSGFLLIHYKNGLILSVHINIMIIIINQIGGKVGMCKPNYGG
ncbi:hypothetical protein, partial [Neisseria meningitidis]